MAIPLPFIREVTATSAIGIAFLTWLFYLLTLAIYRLYFHPLSHFPGPKLAALTKFYEMYYEVTLRGKFTFHIQDLHKIYGPIVRVTPFEVHIEDPSYFDTLYLRPKADRYDWMNGRFGNDSSVFTTSGHALHKVRRGALSPMCVVLIH